MTVELGIPTFVVKILGVLIGKNAAHFGRKLTTYIGGLLLASVVFQGGVIDPSLTVDPAMALPTQADVEDGLTVGEAIRLGFGMILIWTSRLMSFLRASNRDGLANILGALVGRNLQSLFRAALTVVASFLTWIGVSGVDAPGLAGEPLFAILGAIISLLGTGASSFFLDSKANPVQGLFAKLLNK